MPFVKTDMIAEARELQKEFKNSPYAVQEFKEFEKQHIEQERLKQQEEELINQLIAIRKQKNITQKELQEKTGLTQQAISRLEVNKEISPSLKTLIKYTEAINCKLIAIEK